ncbi:MAG: hypothetical protein BJ554DRAFT_7129 [Olpidium bornovanus]|uniref:Uncharacterized protein n=1 Tax=Olpidium bornovanus TaxID=278681 RepID=A0A8H8DM88_9FUNG|nr:MAG: hypothetical protein BJ554DRAFT_7129 [Olpidium bornovanus]
MPSASGMCMRGDEVYLQSSPDGPACVMAAKGSDLMRVIESACNCALGQVLAPEEGTMLIAASAISGSNSASDTRCTWNAFYDKVSLNLILSALDWFAQAGTRFEWILIDDGTIRQRHPYIRHIGVWHTVWGYWNGISPNSRIAEDFCVVEKTTSDQRTVHLVETRVLRFYDEWYRMLRRSGVDFVKVDAQASFELLSGEDRALGSAYRAALRESARKHMGGNVIYCMAHTPGVLWGFSGGPVYLSDNIATHDPRAVTPLLPGGPCSRVLRSRQPAAVCVDSLFEDPTKVDVILKIAARNTEKLAVVAAFNCRPDSELLGAVTICEAFSGILPTGQVFAAYDFKDRTVIHLRRPNCTARAASPALRALTSFVPVFLSARDANVFTFSVVEYPPLSSQRRKIPGICSFGLAGKYNGSAAVLGTEWNAAKDGRFGSRYRYGVKLLRCAGRVAVHLDFRTFDVPETLGPDGIPACVRAATVDGEDVRAAVEYDRRQSILVFASIAGRPELNDLEIQVEVFLG